MFFIIEFYKLLIQKRFNKNELSYIKVMKLYINNKKNDCYWYYTYFYVHEL